MGHCTSDVVVDNRMNLLGMVRGLSLDGRASSQSGFAVGCCGCIVPLSASSVYGEAGEAAGERICDDNCGASTVCSAAYATDALAASPTLIMTTNRPCINPSVV
jgi:hypothetical protein